MAEILFQRALVTAEIEATFGVDPVPVPADDALLVADPDFTADITVIERNFARQSLSPLPIATGRKLAQMTFTAEVRGTGDATGVTAPRLGRLLRACAFSETQITATSGVTLGNTTGVLDTGDTSTTDAFSTAGAFAFGGTNAIIQDGSYRIRVVLGGASATAETRLTGGIFPDDQDTDVANDEDRIPTETFCVELISSVGTVGGVVTVDDTTAPIIPVYDGTGLTGLSVGDVWRITIMGLRFTFTQTVAATVTAWGDDFVTAVAAHTQIAAVNTAGSVAVTLSGTFAGTAQTTDTTVTTLGASGHTVTVGTVTTFVLNDAWTLTTKPVGFEYLPVSTAIESVTIYMYFDGVLHRMTGARGTFTIEGTGGELALFNFTFTGNFETVADAALPAATFETTIPTQVELVKLHINEDVDATAPKPQVPIADIAPVCGTYEDQVNGNIDTLCAGSFSFDLGGEVQPRECINEADSFKGAIFTSRAPSGSIDPELELVATHDFWGLLASADVLGWQVQVGQVRGNVVRLESPSVQYAGLSYAERSGLRVLEADLRFAGSAPAFADDEILIAFN